MSDEAVDKFAGDLLEACVKVIQEHLTGHDCGEACPVYQQLVKGSSLQICIKPEDVKRLQQSRVE